MTDELLPPKLVELPPIKSGTPEEREARLRAEEVGLPFDLGELNRTRIFAAWKINNKRQMDHRDATQGRPAITDPDQEPEFDPATDALPLRDW